MGFLPEVPTLLESGKLCFLGRGILWIDLDRALLSWSVPPGSGLAVTLILVSRHDAGSFQLGIAKEIASERLAGLPAMSQRHCLVTYCRSCFNERCLPANRRQCRPGFLNASSSKP